MELIKLNHEEDESLEVRVLSGLAPEEFSDLLLRIVNARRVLVVEIIESHCLHIFDR